MENELSQRLNTMKVIAQGYYTLPYGALIANHLELLRIFEIQNSIHQRHPHNGMRIYISRRALKHFIESRKAELEKHHTPEETFESICFAIDHIKETINDFDSYQLEPPKHFYTKDYSSEGKPLLRILLEIKEGRLEIISIHFRERKSK
jgi:hypothetical protein